jgi:hypothetical protein
LILQSFDKNHVVPVMLVAGSEFMFMLWLNPQEIMINTRNA